MQTGSTKSQAFRLLHTLEVRGYVGRDEISRGYRLGPRNLLLGERGRREQNGLLQVAHPVMQGLASEPARRQPDRARWRRNWSSSTCANRPNQVASNARSGAAARYTHGGGTTVMLAYAPDDVRDAVLAGPLPAYTAHTETDAGRLRTHLRAIRRQGYAVAIEDLDPGAFSVAAPVRDHGGTVVAAVSVAGSALPASTRSAVRSTSRASCGRPRPSRSGSGGGSSRRWDPSWSGTASGQRPRRRPR